MKGPPMMSRIITLFGLAALGVFAAAAMHAQSPTVDGPVGIDKRIPLTTSRVIGSPDSPPPYRNRKAYDDLKLNHPIHVVHQPGSDRLLVITQRNSYGATKLQRFVDDPKTAELETLIEHNATAYDVIFHPQFADNGYVFVNSNGPDQGKRPKKTQIT